MTRPNEPPGEATLRALLESASQGILAVDEHGIILFVNRKTEELFGYAREELAGQSINLLVPEALRESHRQHLGEYFKRPRSRAMGLGMELAARKKDGTTFPVEVSLSYVDQAGSRMALALVTDITDRKRIEEQLRRSEKLESIGLLAAGIAHDFNNLLVGIMGNASLLLDTSGNEGARDMLDAIVSSSERAAHLTRQLLAFAGKERFAFRPVDPAELIAAAVEKARREIPERIRFELEIARNLPAIEADKAQFQQVIVNLVINAVESFGDDSHGTLRITARAEEISGDDTDLEPGAYVVIEVADDGSGMDEDTLSKAFDPFFTTKFLGRGMGLPASQGVVRSHRGEIRVRSAPGEGSTFIVLVPSIRQPVARMEAPKELATGRTVLVVDDEEIVQQMAKRTLERSGYTVMLANNGLQALEVFANDPDRVSLVLLDLTMPVMGGEETLENLRLLRPSIKVLLSTGYSQADALRSFRGKGLAGFVQKPYTPQRLIAAVRDAMEAVVIK
jgi:two-component system, chemotaxis family, CheB/CheR fusion protein